MRRSKAAIFTVALALLVFCLVAPASGQQSSFETQLSPDNPQVRAVMAIQDQHTPDFMSRPGVLATATGLGDDGKLAVVVYVNQTDAKAAERTIRALPKGLRGTQVTVRLTDPIRALMGPPGQGVDHKALQATPIQLGTSGGWRFDLANGFCCGGTLGSLINVGGQLRILSNYHVFEGDIVNGGNGITAQSGDPIIQPGLIDVGCNANNAQNVATLVVTSSLPGSNVDASSATIIAGQVDVSGAILEVGTISSSTVAAAVSQNVKKSGRTTGLTRSRVTGLNATVSVTYENECAGGTAFTKTFTGQILIRNKGSKFLGGGDSGSLMVEDVGSNPRAVGLLFAGSSSIAVANPIDDVLGFFGASMVGN